MSLLYDMRLFHFNVLFLTSLIIVQPGYGSSGTWTRTSSNVWELNGNWSGAAYPNGTGDDVVFDDTASAFDPTLSGTNDVNDISFSNNSNAYSISGGTIRINDPGADTPNLSLGGSSTTSISSAINLNNTAWTIDGNGTGLVSHTGTLTTSGSTTITKTGSSVFHIDGVDNDSTISDGTKWIINGGEIRIDGNNALGKPSSEVSDYITINGGTLSHEGTDDTVMAWQGTIDVGASGATFRNYSTAGNFNIKKVNGSAGGDVTVLTESTKKVIFDRNTSPGSLDGNLYIGNTSGAFGRVGFDRLEQIPTGTIIFNVDNAASTETNQLESLDSDGGTVSSNIQLERHSGGSRQTYKLLNQVDNTTWAFSGNITTASTNGTTNLHNIDIAVSQGVTTELSGNNDFSGIDRMRFIHGSDAVATTLDLKLGDTNALDNLALFRFHQTQASGVTMRLLSTVAGTYTPEIKDNTNLDDNTTLVVGGEHSSGNVTYSGAINMITSRSGGNNTTLQLYSANSGAEVTYSGVIDDDSSNVTLTVEATGNGDKILTGANTYVGNTTLSSGTLFANNGSGSATGTGSVTVASGSRIGGSGSISGNLTLSAGAHVAAGSDYYTAGNLNVTHTGSDNVWNGNGSGTYIWNIEDFSGAAGSAWDVISFTGSLDVINTSGLYKIYIESISSAGSLGLASNQSASGSNIKILDTGGVGNFKLGGATATNGLLDSYFQLDDTGYFNGNTQWWLTTDGQALYLNYQVVPEPGTWMMMGGVTLFLCFQYFRSRKRRRASLNA